MYYGFYCYYWVIYKDGEFLFLGFDVMEVDGEGCVFKVIGFFGFILEV